MNIQLSNVLPNPLSDKNLNSDVWNRSLEFIKGNKYHITAPSGTGKTTCLHLIYGLRSDFSEDIIFDPKPESRTGLRRNHLSIVFQDLMLEDELTAWENILIKQELQNSVSESELIDFAKRLNIDHVLHRKVEEISRGERQRVAIIRALSMRFDWLLLDEPFSHLDAKNTENAIALIEERVGLYGAGLILANIHEDDYFEYNFELKL